MLSAITAAVGVESMTLIIIALTLVLFASDKLPVGLVAMISSIVLGIMGCMPVSKVYSGWSRSLTIMVMGMIVVGDAMFQTGAVTMIGRLLEGGYDDSPTSFADNDAIPSWSAQYVSILTHMGVLTGGTDNAFHFDLA